MISVIVPVYNAQAFLEPCIKSVLTQSFRELELILIDDGSTDRSLEMCRRWETDPRVTIVSTENRGVSAARNMGLSAASGQWILFLDSDDFLLPDCLERLMTMVTPETREIIGAYTVEEAAPSSFTRETVSADALRAMTLDPINHRLLPEFYEVKPLSLCSCWAKLYRMDVIREYGLRFREELRLSEDTLFNLEYLSCIDHAVVTNLCLISYRQNMSSVTRRFNAKQLSNRFRFFDRLKEPESRDAAVHILSLLFLEACKLERYTKGSQRTALEQEIIGYLSDNADLLRCVKGCSLSQGRWQNAAYLAAAACFRRKAFHVGFAVLRSYAMLTLGELNRFTTNE